MMNGAERYKVQLPLKVKISLILNKAKSLNNIRQAISEEKLKIQFKYDYWEKNDGSEMSELYAQFRKSKLDWFIEEGEDEKIQAILNLFSSSTRNLMVYNIITRVRFRDSKGEPKDLFHLMNLNVYLNFYPLHDGSKSFNSTSNLRSDLVSDWKNMLTPQPIQMIRDYYGEKIAFYFAWLEHYTFWLGLAGIFGLCVTLYGIFISFDSLEIR